jgi:DNA-binding transcriptional LysR family regulator
MKTDPEATPLLELRHLRYFVAVAEELHFGRAATRLGMAQPPLSQQIQRLESIVGHELFVRRPRVALTAAGESFLRTARETLDRVSRGVADARRFAEGQRGELHLGFAASALTTPFPAIVRRYRQAYPGVRLDLRELSTAEQLEALRRGAIDAGVVRESGSAEELRKLPLLREPFVAVLPPRHRARRRRPIPLAEFAEEPFVLFPREVATTLYDEVMDLCRSAAFTPRVVQEAREWMTIVGLVEAGLGVSLVPASFARLRWGGVAYQELTGSRMRTSIFLCVPRVDCRPTALALFETAKEEVQHRR